MSLGPDSASPYTAAAYKSCTKCGESKALDEFTPDRRATDGRGSSCKACRRADRAAYVAKRLASDPAAYREARKRHNRKHYETHRDSINARRKQWPRGPISPEARERKRARDRRWKQINREKALAHQEVAHAIERHELHRPIFCSECRQMCRHSEIHAHHEDYSRPLDVTWLCIKCHRARHS